MTHGTIGSSRARFSGCGVGERWGLPLLLLREQLDGVHPVLPGRKRRVLQAAGGGEVGAEQVEGLYRLT